MHILLVTPIPLLADSLSSAFCARDETATVEVAASLAALLASHASSAPDVVLIDVRQGIDWDALEQVAAALSEAALWALGLDEDLRDAKRRGKGVFAGYLNRSASIDTLYSAISNPDPNKRRAHRRETSAGPSGSSIRRWLCRLRLFRCRKSG